jgi:hypothetical protein
LERAAHSLKGLAALFGSPGLADQFLAIEDAAEAGDATRVQAALAGLDARVDAAVGQLRGWLKGPAPRAGA